MEYPLNTPRQMTVTNYIPYSPNGTGFALPVFAHPDEKNAWYTQEISEFTKLVDEFRRLDSPLPGVRLADGPSTHVGAEQLYVFIDEVGKPNGGTLADITPILREFVIRCNERSAICLQVMELIGAPEEKRAARVRMRKLVQERTGQRAAQSFYEVSCARQALWTNLADSAKSEAILKDIVRVRSQLTAEIGDDGALVINIEALDPNTRRQIDTEHLQNAMKAELQLREFARRRGAPPSASTASSRDDDKFWEKRVNQVLHMIASARRQEERLALLLRSILDDPALGNSVLDTYRRDAAEFANRVIEEYKYLRTHMDVSNSVIHTVDHALSRVYGMRRGILLLEFAKHLGRYGQINAMLRRRLDHTHSRYVEPYRRQIDAILKDGRHTPLPMPSGQRDLFKRSS